MENIITTMAPAQVDPRAMALRVRQGAPLRFTPVVADAALNSEDDAELDAGLDDGVKGNVDDVNSCVGLAISKDEGVDVVAGKVVVELITEGPGNWEEVSE